MRRYGWVLLGVAIPLHQILDRAVNQISRLFEPLSPRSRWVLEVTRLSRLTGVKAKFLKGRTSSSVYGRLSAVERQFSLKS